MEQKKHLIIYWSRRDFRLHDNPALISAVETSRESNLMFLPMFILEDYMVNATPEFQFGYPSRYFVSRAVPHFATHFKNFLIFQGKPGEIFKQLSATFELTIFVNEDIYIDFYKQIKKIKSSSIAVKIFKDYLTVDRETKTGEGNYYSVFTPFKKSVWNSFLDSEVKHKADLSLVNPLPQDVLATILKNFTIVSTQHTAIWDLFSKQRTFQAGDLVVDLDTLTDAPTFDMWYYDEEAARTLFSTFLISGNLAEYKDNRDSLELDTTTETVDTVTLYGKTSKMSVALAWGLISSRTLKEMTLSHFQDNFRDIYSLTSNAGALSFLSELIWREFYKYLYFHNTDLLNTEFQVKFRGKIDWVADTTAHKRFTAWITGQTGYPIVDASMKQLAKTGWMHNRSRMIVASILSKNLGVDWRWGQEYFRATLIDLDETSNNGGWQWGASVGADPKPIRIFNAELQVKNYDKSGAYQNTWLDDIRADTPIVEHRVGREEALKRYGLSHQQPRDF